MQTPPRTASQGLILLGRVHGAFGVRGELKLESWTQPRNAIFHYQPWTLRDAQGHERELSGAHGRESPKGLVVVFPDVADRDAAEAMRGTDVYVPRSALPPASVDEYYWVDLEGLRVVNVQGIEFGHVSHLFSTGANDVVVVHGERERMIPFLQPDYITAIDFAAGLMTVDWDVDF